MIRLTTVGAIAISIGDTPVSPSNHQVFSAILFLVVERGRPVSRRVLAELLFPDSSEQGHSARQLIYRLRKLGIRISSDQRSVMLPSSTSAWDVEEIVDRGFAFESELEALHGGYLSDFSPHHSTQFDLWLEEHRSLVGSRLRHLLVRQIRAEKANRRFRALEATARACLALDPMNEDATLAIAEALAMTGSKLDALDILDRYINEIRPSATSLRTAPSVLRERISAYVIDTDREPIDLVGRESELAVISSALGHAVTGSAQLCLVTGPSGIGKSRLLEEATAVAALSGIGVIRVRIHPHDVARPFALLRDLGPSLLDLPGSIGASPEALATLRGLCGRGPSIHKHVPSGAFETHAVVSEVHSRVLEVLDSVAEEQPLLISVEDAQWIDEASQQLISDMLDGQRPLCVLAASQRPIHLLIQLETSLAVSSLPLGPLNPEQSRTLLIRLFGQTRRPPDARFIETAVSTAGGVPFYLHLLFHNFLATGDPESLPPTLSESLATRLAQLTEPAVSVFDAVVILGPYSTESRLEVVTQLPRYLLLQALRWLEEYGFLRNTNGAIAPAHDLLATAVRKRMPQSVARLLHRVAALTLESDTTAPAEPVAIAMHWEACQDNVRAVNVLTLGASQFSQIGRPTDAIELLLRARGLAMTEAAQTDIDVRLIHICRAAGADGAGVEVSKRLGLYSGGESSELQVIAFEFLVGAGQALVPFAARLEEIAGDGKAIGEVRAHAARLLAILAEDLGDAALCRRAVELISDARELSCEVIGTRLIYHTVFGSSQTAISLAADLREAAIHMPMASERVKYISNAGVAMWRCGNSELALLYLEEAYHLAREAKVWSACTAYAAVVAEHYWILGVPESADAWFELASESRRKSKSADRGLSFIGLAIMIALDKGQVEEAADLLAEAESRFPRVRTHRMGLHSLALRIRIALAAGNNPSDADLSELAHGHLEHREHGLHDFVADTLVAALDARREYGRARRFQGEYLVLRKDRFPIAPSFSSLRRTDALSAQDHLGVTTH